LTPPKEIRHNFLFAFDLTTASADGSQTFRCAHCGQWTADPETGPATLAVCPQSDRRRKARRERRERRA
jgi:hypothetical protein